MNPKGFTTPQIIIFILALAVVVGGYFAFGGKTQAPVPQVQTPTSTVAALDTSNWRTYTNNQYGFEFKYPAQFYVVSESPGSTESGDIRFSVALDDIQFKGQERFRHYTTIAVYEKPSLETFFNGLVDDLTGQKLNITKQEKISDNPAFYKIYLGNSGTFHGVAVKGDMYAYIVSGSGPTVDQVLSSFKFISQ